MCAKFLIVRPSQNSEMMVEPSSLETLVSYLPLIRSEIRNNNSLLTANSSQLPKRIQGSVNQ